MRGRKPDAASQAAKGNPGKRKKRKVKRPSAEETAARLAAAEAASAGHSDQPVFLADIKLKDALTIWRELEPDLRRLHLLDRLDRHTFAMYCVHMADWIEATRDIQKRGHWKNVKNVNGDLMPRLNPMVKVREIAERHILDIGSRFGLDPANRYKLLRDQHIAHAANPDLFTRKPQSDELSPPTGDPTTPALPEDGDLKSPLGLMDDLATTPPGTRPN